jgi:anaerobic magnesium-protoporphyrin IX monomethyl ester cyclase
MKYDYLRNQKHKPRKPWWEEKINKELRSSIYHQLLEKPTILGQEFAALELNEKDLFKHTVMEILPFDLHHYLTARDVQHTSSVMLIYFDPIELVAKTYSAPVSAFQSEIVK